MYTPSDLLLLFACKQQQKRFKPLSSHHQRRQGTPLQHLHPLHQQQQQQQQQQHVFYSLFVLLLLLL